MLKTEESVRYRMSIPLSEPLNCIKQHYRKHDTEKSRGQDTSLLNPICDGKGYRGFSFVLHPCIHSVMELSNDGEFFGAAVFCHHSPKAISADHVKCLGQINISRVEVGVLFLTLVLLQTPCQQSLVPYGSHINSLVRVYVWDGCWDDSGLWLGSCPKLKIRRFRSDYHMPVGSLSVCKYGWWRRPWSPAVVLSPISAEWGSDVYSSALIHPPYRFPQELSQIRVLCRWIVNG